MLKLDSNTDKPDYQLYHSLLFRYTKGLVNVEHLDRLIAIDGAVLNGYLRRMFLHMESVTGNEYTEITPDILVKYLTTYEDVPMDYFEKVERTSTGKRYTKIVTSLDRIKWIRSRGLAVDFLDIYIPYAELVYAHNGIVKNRSRMIKSNLVGYNGNPMYELNFYYTRAVTGRTYTKSASLQAVAKRYLTCFQAPKDYYILWCDFDQIDLRVAMELCLRHPSQSSLDVFLDSYSDKYEAFARYMYDINKMEFNYEQFKEDRGKYKQSILACIYQSSESALASTTGDRAFAYRLYKTINENPRYIEYMKSLLTNMSIPENFTVKCYFGSERIDVGGRPLNARSFFNTPIQGTSQEVMELFTRNVCERMGRVSKGNPNAFMPLFNRHDEMLFLVHKSMLCELHTVIDCMKIQVDDWKMLELDWHIGTVYGVEDEDVMQTVKASLVDHPQVQQPKSFRLSTYYPSERTLELFYTKYYYGNSSFKAMYKGGDSFSEQFLIFASPGNLRDEGFIQKCILEVFNDLIKSSYDRVVIYGEEDGYLDVDGVEVYLINKESDGSYQSYMTQTKRLCNRYITQQLNKPLPSDLVGFDHVPISKEIKKVWWI